MSGPAQHTQNPRVILPYKKAFIVRHIISTQESNLIIWIYMTDNLELNKKILYYRKNGVTTVYITI